MHKRLKISSTLISCATVSKQITYIRCLVQLLIALEIFAHISEFFVLFFFFITVFVLHFN